MSDLQLQRKILMDLMINLLWKCSKGVNIYINTYLLFSPQGDFLGAIIVYKH